MANALKGEVSLKHDDEEFLLVFDVDALCRLEGELDAPIEEILVMMAARRPRATVARALLWAGLRRHHALSIELVGQRFLGPGGVGVRGALALASEALALAFPKPDAPEVASGAADPPAADGTGPGSSDSGAS